MDVMPDEKNEKPRIMLKVEPEEPVVTEPATVEDLARVSETVAAAAGTPEVSIPVEVTKVEGGGGKWIWVWAGVGLLLGIAVGGGAGYMIWGNKRESVVVGAVGRVELPAAEDKTGPTPTVAMEVKRSELKVKVLNGSGVKGEAAKAKALLEGLGYKDVVTGNADRDDYEQTEVTAAKDEYGRTVKADLESKYTVSLKGGTADLGEFDAVITLGGI